MIKSFLTKLQTFKAGMEMLPLMVEQIQNATAESRVASLLQHPRYQDAKSLVPHRFKLFSQYGQDGIIAEIFRRIGPGSRRFVEIGTAPLENNTAMLLLQGWSGLWMDAALPDTLPGALDAVVKEGRLVCERSFLNRENVCPLISKCGFDSDLDFLSVDVDHNTYHILEPCLSLRPRALAVEYNSQLPEFLDWVAPYGKDAVWDSSLAYGASLKALERLTRGAGYSLVGCELSGTDAFFVRDDLLGDNFHAPYSAEHHWEPLRMGLDVKTGHHISFPPGIASGR